jgi:hypothetical protein
MYIWSLNWLEWLLIISYVQLSVLLAVVIFLATRGCFLFSCFSIWVWFSALYFRNFSWCSTSDTSSEKEIQEVPDHMKMISMTSPFAVWTQVLLRAAAGFFDRGPDVHIHGRCSCSKKYFRSVWWFFHPFSFNQCSWSPSFLGTFVLMVTWNHSCIHLLSIWYFKDLEYNPFSIFYSNIAEQHGVEVSANDVIIKTLWDLIKSWFLTHTLGGPWS